MVYEGNHKLGDLFASRRERGKPGLPTLSVTLTDGLVNRETLERKTDTNLSESEHLLVKEGDIAYNMMRMWQGASGRAGKDGLVSPAYIVLAPTKYVDSSFAAYLFKTQRLIYLFWAYSYGLTSDRLRLYFNDFSRIPVDVPRIEEQRKIAQILSTWDRAIETTEKLIENSRAQKRALMQQFLTGESRLTGFFGDFERLHFKDVAGIDRESLNNSTPADHSFRYISLSDVETGNIVHNLQTYFFADAPSRARKKVLPGDILMSTVRPNLQGFARVSESEASCVASTGFSVLSVKNGYDGDYLYHYLFSSHITGQLNALVVGSNYPAINSSDVKGLVIYCPSYEEQRAISKVLNNCDQVAERLRSQLGHLKQEKKSLMQQLLTGKRRMKVEG